MPQASAPAAPSPERFTHPPLVKQSAAGPMVAVFEDTLRALGADVASGIFGADMRIELVNDGPVTVMLEL